MTDQQINLAIAEACGWKLEEKPFWKGMIGYAYTFNGQTAGSAVGFFGWGWHSTRESAVGQLPSYCTDLNEIHKAERTLTIESFAKYENELCKVVDASGTDSDIWFYVLTATAHQRAHAFLLTLGLWRG